MWGLFPCIPVFRVLYFFGEKKVLWDGEGEKVRFLHELTRWVAPYATTLSIWVFPMKNVFAKLWLPHPDLSFYLITSTFSLNVKSFFRLLRFWFSHFTLFEWCLQKSVSLAKIRKPTFISATFSFLKMKGKLLIM